MSAARLRKISAGIVMGVLVALIPAGAHGATTTPIGVFAYPCSSNSAVGNFRGIRGEHDLAVGAPGDSLTGKGAIDGSSGQGSAAAGSVNVVYPSTPADGFKEGLDPTTGAQFFSEGSPGIAQSTLRAVDGDAFGFAVAAGDFNGDGRDDLAIGVPGKDSRAGAVVVLYGGPAGLVNGSSQIIRQGVGNIRGASQAGAEFGYALASGDFNGDGVKDLAVGAPRYDAGSQKDAGTVNIIFGKSGVGLVSAGNQWLNQGNVVKSPEGPRAEQDDRFGASLAAGSLADGNHPAEDLAIGAPGEDLGSAADNGSVLILHGVPTKGLTTTNEVFMYPGAKDMPAGAQSGADFGCSLSIGDFNGDHLGGPGAGPEQDLAIGAPGLNQAGQAAAGAVFVVYNSGTATGVTPVEPSNVPDWSAWHSADLWSEDSPGIPGVATKGAHFAASLASGDFNGDGAVDLGIGLPNQAVYGKDNAGSVRVIDGIRGIGLTDADRHAFAQGASDPTAACFLDNTPVGAGCTLSLGGPADYSPLWMVAEQDDGFGTSLAAGDFNNDGKADLSIGVPGEDYGEFVNYLTEEKGEIPSTILSDNGIPVSLSVDEQKDAGIVQIVNGPFPSPSDEPAAQQIIVRQGHDSLNGLGEAIRQNVLYNLPAGLFQDDQIPGPTNGDRSWSNDLTGDGFGGSQG